MSIDLIALTAMSGLPLFTRRLSLDYDSLNSSYDDNDGRGSNEIALNTVATLYGLNLFSRLNECELNFAKSTNGKTNLKWKIFEGSIAMIVVSNNVDFVDTANLDILMQLVFDSIVMMCGLNEITNINIERLKRNLRIAYPLIDYLLNSFVSNTLDRIGLITQNINYAFASRSSFVDSIVNSISHTSSNNYCASALFVHKKLLSASKSWWSRLNLQKDSFLITCLFNSLSDTDLVLTKEIPIHLPHISSSLRLIVSQITKGVVLCILCSEQLSLEYIEAEFIVPLNDPKLQIEKLSRYKSELRNSKYLSQSTLISILNNHVSILKHFSAFIFFHYEHRFYFVFNENMIENNMEDVIVFNEIERGLKQCSNSCSSYFMDDQLNIYRVNSKSILLSVLFEPNQSVKQMSQVTHTLADAILKAKHFWP